MKNFFFLIFFLLITNGLSAQMTIDFDIEITGASEQHAILLPGFSCAGAVWKTTVAQLKSTYTCHVFTMPGFAGRKKAETVNFNIWTQQIAEYIKTKKLGKATIIGHSMGGMMALQLAADFPDLIEQIVVVDALPSLAALNKPSFKADPAFNCEPVIAMFTKPTEEQFLINQKMGIAGMSANQEQHEQIISWAVDSDKSTLGEIYCQLMNFDARETIEQISCPALILLEANFQSIRDIIDLQYQKLTTADLRYANQGLHFVMYDDPIWYKKQLEDFLKTAEN